MLLLDVKKLFDQCQLYADIYLDYRQRDLGGKAHAVDGTRRVRVHERVGRAIPAPEANAELQVNLDVSQTDSILFLRYITMPNAILVTIFYNIIKKLPLSF